MPSTRSSLPSSLRTSTGPSRHWAVCSACQTCRLISWPGRNLLRQVKDALLADLKKPVVITGADARVGMHGMGGIGKSVLAAAIARDREVRRSYPDGIIWLTIGQRPNLVTLQHDVARYLGSKEHFDTEPEGQDVLRRLLGEKAVLLVLDDVWQARDTQAFDVLSPRCRALVTTRDVGILHTLGGPSVPVSLLTEQQALQLLADAVGVEPSALPPQALEVVKKCEYLPLAVALCGGMVKKHGGDWTVVLERLHGADIEKIGDRQAIDKRHQSIWRAMKVSVDALPSKERRRFAELAVFARDNPVPEAAVATLWSHTGNLSDLDTTDLLINLAERSLIRLGQTTAKPGNEIDRRISLHDLLYDFATKLIEERTTLHATLLDAYRKRCPSGWPTGPNDGYFFQRVPWHLMEVGQSGELRGLLLDFKWLQAKLDATDVNAALTDANYFSNDQTMQLLADALRLDAHALASDKNDLRVQLYARLMEERAGELVSLRNQIAHTRDRPWLRLLRASLIVPGGPLLRTLEGHTNRVLAVAVSANGRLAVSGSSDDTVMVWDLSK